MGVKPARRLIVNADDFGRSESINLAVIRAHCEGILTTASLMVNGAAFGHALELAHEHPTLGVGLHLTLAGGRSTLKPTEIPGLVDNHYYFTPSPVWAGLKYFFFRGLNWQLRHEILGQFRKFQSTGLVLDHVNGHLNIHLHPSILRILLRNVDDGRLGRMRLTRDPFLLNAQLAEGRWFYRVSHAMIFGALSAWARPRLRRHGVRHTEAVFGLLQNGAVDTAYLTALLARLPEGDFEVYMHPSLDEFKHEFEALISDRAQVLVRDRNIELIRYQDL